METRRDDEREDQDRDKPREKDFQIEKLEERIAPAGNSIVSVTPSGNFHVRPPGL